MSLHCAEWCGIAHGSRAKGNRGVGTPEYLLYRAGFTNTGCPGSSEHHLQNLLKQTSDIGFR